MCVRKGKKGYTGARRLHYITELHLISSLCESVLKAILNFLTARYTLSCESLLQQAWNWNVLTKCGIVRSLGVLNGN
jgi:hypothetical protein